MKSGYRFLDNPQRVSTWVPSPHSNVSEWLAYTFGGPFAAHILSEGERLVLGGYFSVERGNVRRYPLEIYRAMSVQQVAQSEEVDHFIERAWGLLFTSRRTPCELLLQAQRHALSVPLAKVASSTAPWRCVDPDSATKPDSRPREDEAEEYTPAACARSTLPGFRNGVSKHGEGARVGDTNFQGQHACFETPRLVSITSLAELAQAIIVAQSVKAVGAGHGWSRNFIGCAARHGVNILTAGLCAESELTARHPFFFIGDPGGEHCSQHADVLVDSTTRLVQVRTCVTIQALLEVLSACRTQSAPGGYQLYSPATLYTGQTVGGAIATATHGASLEHGGWSNLVQEAEIMLANGTIMHADRVRHPRMMRALSTSLGRLGVVLSVTLHIVPQTEVTMTSRTVSSDEFRSLVNRTVSAIAAHVGPPHDNRSEKVPEAPTCGAPCGLNVTTISCAPLLRQAPLHDTMTMIKVDRMGRLHAKMSSWRPACRMKVGGDRRRCLDWRSSAGSWFEMHGPERRQAPVLGWQALSFGANDTSVRPDDWLNPTLQPRSTYMEITNLAQLPNQAYFRTGHSWRLYKYNQTEFAIPYTHAVRCLDKLFHVLTRSGTLGEIDVTRPWAVRFSGRDDSLLSHARSGPVMWINHDSFEAGPYPDAVLVLLRSPVCSGALHWGKHGWDDPVSRFASVSRIGEGWCEFSCISRELDPRGKFAGGEIAGGLKAYARSRSPPQRLIPDESFFSTCCHRRGQQDAPGFDSRACECRYAPFELLRRLRFAKRPEHLEGCSRFDGRSNTQDLDPPRWCYQLPTSVEGGCTKWYSFSRHNGNARLCAQRSHRFRDTMCHALDLEATTKRKCSHAPPSRGP